MRALQTQFNGIAHDVNDAAHFFKNRFGGDVAAGAFVIYGQFPEGFAFISVVFQHFGTSDERYLQVLARHHGQYWIQVLDESHFVHRQ